MLFLVEQTFGTGLADHLRQFEGGDGDLEFVLGFDTHQSQHPVGAHVVERDEQPGGVA